MIPSLRSEIPLGKAVGHSRLYDPGQLFAIPRASGRQGAGIDSSIFPFWGIDVWNIYELSWLTPSGKPQVAMAEIQVPADSPNLVESKSLKLYLNSYNMTPFEDADAVRETITKDLGQCVMDRVAVRLRLPKAFREARLAELGGGCIDHCQLRELPTKVTPTHLVSQRPEVDEALFTRLFRSLCPVTGQPDWAAVGIVYSGPRIDHQGLLTYLVSYREHAGFHETCVERIFQDVMQRCKPKALKVVARFTRRGGIDINPIRATGRVDLPLGRDPRQ